MKRCFKCGETKDLAAFYAHPRMADGRLNKCIECAKKDVKANRNAKLEKYSLYDQSRNRTKRRRFLLGQYSRSKRERHPEKYAARMAVGNAIRDGRLSRQPCESCGTTADVEAHHDDYSKPLDVRWLCFKHHRELAHGQRVIVAHFR